MSWLLVSFGGNGDFCTYVTFFTVLSRSRRKLQLCRTANHGLQTVVKLARLRGLYHRKMNLSLPKLVSLI
jgi:hypothetical protein